MKVDRPRSYLTVNRSIHCQLKHFVDPILFFSSNTQSLAKQHQPLDSKTSRTISKSAHHRHHRGSRRTTHHSIDSWTGETSNRTKYFLPTRRETSSKCTDRCALISSQRSIQLRAISEKSKSFTFRVSKPRSVQFICTKWQCRQFTYTNNKYRSHRRIGRWKSQRR